MILIDPKAFDIIYFNDDHKLVFKKPIPILIYKKKGENYYELAKTNSIIEIHVDDKSFILVSNADSFNICIVKSEFDNKEIECNFYQVNDREFCLTVQGE